LGWIRKTCIIDVRFDWVRIVKKDLSVGCVSYSNFDGETWQFSQNEDYWWYQQCSDTINHASSRRTLRQHGTYAF
jgi:hypothetical protein